MRSFSTKIPDERIFLSVDFQTRLQAGVEFTAAETEIEVCTGTDPDAQTMLDGSPAISGQIIGQWVVNGVDGATYVIAFRGTADDGSVVEQKVLLPVKEKPI